MRDSFQRDMVEEIVSQFWTYAYIQDRINGWKIVKNLPEWALDHKSWTRFVKNEEQDTNMQHEDKSIFVHNKEEPYQYESSNSDKYNKKEYRMPFSNTNDYNSNYKQDTSDSEEYEDEVNSSKKGENDSYHNDTRKRDHKKAFKSNNDIYTNNEHKNDYNNLVRTSRFKSNEERYVEIDDENSVYNNEDNNELNNSKIMSVKTDCNYQFEGLFDGDFRTKVEDCYIKSSSHSSKMNVFITGPFRNNNTKMSHYIVVLDDMKKAYVLKSPCMQSYFATIMSRLHLDSNFCKTFYDINIRRREFDMNDNCWRRNKNGKTSSRLSFVFSCNTTKEDKIQEDIGNTIEILWKSMEVRNKNPIGPLVVEFLKQNQTGLYNYLMKYRTDERVEDDVGIMLTQDIHNQFKCGYTLKWNDSLNRCMVDYDIIRVLKNNVGYKSWEEVGMQNIYKCYKDYNKKFILPEWDIEQENY